LKFNAFVDLAKFWLCLARLGVSFSTLSALPRRPCFFSIGVKFKKCYQVICLYIYMLADNTSQRETCFFHVHRHDWKRSKLYDLGKENVSEHYRESHACYDWKNFWITYRVTLKMGQSGVWGDMLTCCLYTKVQPLKIYTQYIGTNLSELLHTMYPF